ncbi:MAG: glycerol-3-phosphate 1-O-acyltransferase PlsY [Kiritimatiellae bacterium]|nr:glycerol-3-phosphate 1-O-acyltransferase PlsY [Kiritimatiellia bacterium]
MTTTIIVWLLAAYLIGGIPFGFIIGKCRGVDVRTVGSKNIGATNVFRTVGKKWGFLALFLDMMKGFAPTYLCKCLCPEIAWLALAVGVTCAVGHMLTPYMKFKGGKGVATGAGMLFGLAPALMGVTFLVFVALFACSNYISLGSCGAATFIGIAIWFPILGNAGYHNVAQCVLVTLIAAFIVYKHRANIGRLIAGNENKIYIFKKPEAK